MRDKKNKGTQNSDIRAQHENEHKTEKKIGNKYKTITYGNTESKEEESG